METIADLMRSHPPMTMACIGNTVKVDGGLLDVAAFIQKKVDSGSPCRNDGFHAKMRIADQRHYQLRTELSIFDISPIRASFSSDASFLTGFFAFFAFIHSFNTFNARTESLNLFDNLSGKKKTVSFCWRSFFWCKSFSPT